jgi:hypothetical protein
MAKFDVSRIGKLIRKKFPKSEQITGKVLRAKEYIKDQAFLKLTKKGRGIAKAMEEGSPMRKGYATKINLSYPGRVRGKTLGDIDGPGWEHHLVDKAGFEAGMRAVKAGRPNKFHPRSSALSESVGGRHNPHASFNNARNSANKYAHLKAGAHDWPKAKVREMEANAAYRIYKGDRALGRAVVGGAATGVAGAGALGYFAQKRKARGGK